MACEQVSPKDWKEKGDDLRLVLRGVLPDPGQAPAAKAIYTDSWRGLWRLVNVFQELRGFHVEVEGLDTLPPPDMSAAADGLDRGTNGQAWMEARALCDETIHPLIDALVAAGGAGPDRLGDDLVVGGRVVGMMEFGWSVQRVAVTDKDPGGTGWNLIGFNPETDGLAETVTRILQALEGAQS
jgi:DEAD/DEAH box helicase domain-containing protein